MKITTCSIVLILMLANSSFGQQGKLNETIIIRTGLGEIQAEIFLNMAPVTSGNFLRYVDARLFDSSCFYRVVRMDNQPKDSVKIEVIQGGLYKNEDKGFPPIIHEATEMTGIMHTDGTISMARSNPGSATSEFFICVGDQPELDFGGKRNPDRQGFAAFGRVTSGMEVVRRIQNLSTSGQYLEKPVLISEIVREAK